MTVDDICRVLCNARYHYHSEKGLQQGVNQLLSELGVNFRPEYSLSPRNRIDFLIETLGIGIECKVDGTLNALLRQISRYAATGKISDLIVLTTRSIHQRIPTQLHGVSVFVVVISPLL